MTSLMPPLEPSPGPEPATPSDAVSLPLHREVFERVDRAIAEIRSGRMVILVDDEDRENEGDLCMAAELVRPADINFMAKYGRGLICLTLTEDQVNRLGLPMMEQVGRGGPTLGTAFTVSIEARHGVSTGISAADRAHTIRMAANPSCRPEDLVTPGHVFPLRARNGGVLVRTGQTEGSVDLARLAGLTPAGVICEIMNDDGSMARRADLERFAAEHGLLILSIADLIAYRLRMDRLVRRIREATVTLDQTRTPWRAIIYEDDLSRRQMLALVKGEISPAEPTLVRMHAGSTMADLFASSGREGGKNLRASIEAIETAGSGVLVYFPPQSDLTEQLAPLAPQAPTPARRVLHEYGLGAQILANLGVRRMRLLTNNPRKIPGLEGFGLEIIDRVSLGDP
ncbi:MAG: 3,4-dihydroxy-2-butanone-4-phosphate synthase [Myxococcales bacterium]|nr:3,4-dihydroxy-2-butanone-4-phosphate synthase [Polyangiaceae bacterium]MDW8250506.1 3,4-dihydroxy-2-butanone-4-phosphate synthase [Myxococcales bacterium]